MNELAVKSFPICVRASLRPSVPFPPSVPPSLPLLPPSLPPSLPILRVRGMAPRKRPLTPSAASTHRKAACMLLLVGALKEGGRRGGEGRGEWIGLACYCW